MKNPEPENLRYQEVHQIEILQLVERIKKLADKHHLTLGTIESITGGGIAQALTSLAGASSFYCGSIVAYSNKTKIKLLEIPPELFQSAGVYSEQMAAAMAEQGRRLLECDVTLSLTGLAGPSSQQESPETGSVFFGVSSLKHTTTSFKKFPISSRQEIRYQSCLFGLQYLYDVLLEIDASKLS